MRKAMERRRETLIERGNAARQPDDRVTYLRNLIAALQEREVARTGTALAAKKGMPLRTVAEGETVT